MYFGWRRIRPLSFGVPSKSIEDFVNFIDNAIYMKNQRPYTMLLQCFNGRYWSMLKNPWLKHVIGYRSDDPEGQHQRIERVAKGRVRICAAKAHF
jgi:hypothetical protein